MKIIKLIILTCLFINSHAQTFEWVRTFGSSTVDEGGYSIVVDNVGNTYSCGWFGASTDFDPGPGSFIMTPLDKDVYISKFDASGNFLWAKQFTGPGEDLPGRIALDNAGNIYVTGYFNDSCDFDTGIGSFFLHSVGGTDAFVCKLTSNGDLIWAKGFTGAGVFDIAGAVSVDITGNVYTGGIFFGTMDFDPGPGTYNITAAGMDCFIVKLDANGDFIWARSFGGTDQDALSSLVGDSIGNIYITGDFRNTVDFDPGPGIFQMTAQVSDVFVAHFDSAGAFIWAKQVEAANSYALRLDVNHDIVITGGYTDTVDFDPGTGTSFMYSDVYGAFILKLTDQGDFLWANHFTGTGTAYCDAYELDFDTDRNIYLTGNFLQTIDFDPGPGIYNLFGAGSKGDFFIAKLNPEGDFEWAVGIGGTVADASYSIAVHSPSNSVYTTGTFKGSVDFDPGLGIVTQNSGAPAQSNAFIHKLHSLLSGVINHDENQDIIVCPNPCSDYVTVSTGKIHENNGLEIREANGKLLYSISGIQGTATIDVSGLSRGVYFLVLTTERGTREVKKLMKQ